ncbi:MAG TPA: iron ABC transporter permease [Chthonomonadaceae bacterium]|nr:iron ABC transporter permease [Chthonomonadaceae bacterium]
MSTITMGENEREDIPSRKRDRRAPVVMPPANRHWRLVFGLLLLTLIGMALLNVWMGSAETMAVVRPGLVLQVIGRHIPFVGAHVAPLPESLPYLDSIVWGERVPRALGGVLIGMLLAMAGVAFQSLLMNPLADPYIVGVSAGSALGSVIVILMGGAGLLAGFAQPLGAFAAGLLTMTLVYTLARQHGRLSAQTFLLAGIVIGTFFWSLTQLCVALAVRDRDPGMAGRILSQLLGSLQGVGWREVGLLLPFALVGGMGLFASWRELDMMAVSEESAAHQGVDTEAFKRRVIVAGSLVTAAAVSVAGIVAFVGLVVPHIARRLVGPRHNILLPAAMLLGGLMLEMSDWLSRVFLNALEIGVVTSLIGAPVFCYLLRRRMSARW